MSAKVFNSLDSVCFDSSKVQKICIKLLKRMTLLISFNPLGAVVHISYLICSFGKFTKYSVWVARVNAVYSQRQ